MEEMAMVSKGAVNQLLDEMGMLHCWSGYTYLMDAILMICSNSKIHQSRQVMKVYDEVAKKHQIPWSRVECGMRTALKRIECKKTCGQFIFWAADHLMFYQNAV